MFSSNDEYTVLYTNRDKIYIYDINLNPSLLCRGSPTRRAFLRERSPSREQRDPSSIAREWVTYHAKHVSSTVGNGSPSIFEENVSPIAREWVTYHAKLFPPLVGI